jgi:GxxExxY protein
MGRVGRDCRTGHRFGIFPATRFEPDGRECEQDFRGGADLRSERVRGFIFDFQILNRSFCVKSAKNICVTSVRNTSSWPKKELQMIENDITYKIRGAAFRVHQALGPGLLESVYEAALKYELEQESLTVKSQLGIPMKYKDMNFDIGFRLDLLVNDLVIVEIKSVESLNEVHFKQTLTYLRLAGKRVGLLINFNVNRLEDKISIVRIINSFDAA